MWGDVCGKAEINRQNPPANTFTWSWDRSDFKFTTNIEHFGHLQLFYLVLLALKTNKDTITLSAGLCSVLFCAAKVAMIHLPPLEQQHFILVDLISPEMTMKEKLLWNRIPETTGSEPTREDVCGISDSTIEKESPSRQLKYYSSLLFHFKADLGFQKRRKMNHFLKLKILKN